MFWLHESENSIKSWCLETLQMDKIRYYLMNACARIFIYKDSILMITLQDGNIAPNFQMRKPRLRRKWLAHSHTVVVAM